MAGTDSNVDTAQLGPITLLELYRSIQDQLVLTIERSLNLGKRSLAGRLDDLLLRQRFWEEDIRLEDGALSDLEANDAVASAIIRRYLDEIHLFLHKIDESISGSDNETEDEKTMISLLHEANTKLCDQVEIFDAIAANEIADAARKDRKATTIGQLRHQLEEGNQKLQSGGENKSNALSAVSPLRDSEVVAANVHGEKSSGKRKADPTAFSTELGPQYSQKSPNDLPSNEEEAFGWPIQARGFSTVQHPLTLQHVRRAGTGTGSAFKEQEVKRTFLDKHASMLYHYNTLVRHESGDGSRIKTAFKIECARVSQWGDQVVPEHGALSIWRVCESILTSNEELLSQLVQLTKTQGLLRGQDIPGQGGTKLDPTYSSATLGLASSWHRPSEEGETVEDSSASGPAHLRKWLEDSVHQLRRWNDILIDLSSRSNQESLSRQLRISLSTNDIMELQYLKSASALLGHSDLESFFETRILVERGLKLHDGRSDMPKQLSALDDNLFWLEKAEIDLRNMSDINSIDSEKIAIAFYRGEKVIIRWLQLRENYMRPNMYQESPQFIASMLKLFGFSKVLNASRVPLGLSSLHILGYFEQRSNLLGCVYRSPPTRSSSDRLVTLRELLDHAGTSKMLEIGKRFELSAALVKTVHELHIMGLVHGDIAPRNILFWPEAATGMELDFGPPYLIGFNLGSLQAPTTDPRPLYDILYQHNNSWYSSISEKCKYSHFDMYNLGLVLFEIEYWGRQWRSFKKFGSSEGSKYGVMTDGVVRDRLGDYVGHKFGDAVKVCLSFKYGAVYEVDDGEENWRAYLNRVRTRVLEPIATCKA